MIWTESKAFIGYLSPHKTNGTHMHSVVTRELRKQTINVDYRDEVGINCRQLSFILWRVGSCKKEDIHHYILTQLALWRLVDKLDGNLVSFL